MDRIQQRRVTPAGIPLNRLVLAHRSVQQEAGFDRQVAFKVLVIASGEALDKVVKAFSPGDGIIVQGFINRTVMKSGEYRLVIHAQSVKKRIGD